MKKFLFIVIFLSILGCIRRSDEEVLVTESKRFDLPPEVRENYRIIQEVNSKNSQINSIVANMMMTIRKKKVSFVLDGELNYEKDRNFRLINKDSKGRFQSDIGSNANMFWIYGKRINPHEMYYDNWSDINKMNISRCLNPLFMIESLGLYKVEIAKAKINRQNGNICITKRQGNVIKLAVINPEKLAIVAHYLYSPNQELIGSSETTEFQQMEGMWLPKTTKIDVIDEGIHIVWYLQRPQINVKISSAKWQMPDLNVRKVDLKSGVTIRDEEE